MKQFFFLPVGLLILLSFPCGAQELEPLNPEWLANDYRSMELILPGLTSSADNAKNHGHSQRP
jgi:hypothetical protein